MTDKELIELAAKAAGIGPCKNFVIAGKVAKIKDTEDLWAPLTDDGDALRLAVKLGIDISFDFDRIDAHGPDFSVTEYLYELPTPTDPYTATRRAIVRAAAEIGRTL